MRRLDDPFLVAYLSLPWYRRWLLLVGVGKDHYMQRYLEIRAGSR